MHLNKKSEKFQKYEILLSLMYCKTLKSTNVYKKNVLSVSQYIFLNIKSLTFNDIKFNG